MVNTLEFPKATSEIYTNNSTTAINMVFKVILKKLTAIKLFLKNIFTEKSASSIWLSQLKRI